MCGIAGFIDFNKKTNYETLKEMVLASKHRGPDDYGVEIFENEFANIGFAQNRLSIIDLSSAGHQPMHFNDLSIIFNGEIYNYKEIKKELETLGHIFISNSDTEVILHSYKEWGEKCVEKFIGMFAFCIYDRTKDLIIIFRDRAGVKPLFYYDKNDVFLIASEMKSLYKHPKFDKFIDTSVLPSFLNKGFVAAPKTIFNDCFKLLPGHFLKINLKNKSREIKKYWDVTDFYRKEKLKIDYNTAKDELHNLLKSAFNYRMVSDVPVGIFLSGGYDSTAVASILQSEQSEQLKTFTIGFEKGNNEAPYAKETAKILGTNHTEYFCTTKEAQSIISDLCFYFDEPFGDSSAIPTMLVSQIAKKDVTVVLSADAGDEIFCGYNSYIKLNSYLKKLNVIPDTLKKTFSYLGTSFIDSIPFTDEIYKYKLSILFQSLNSNNLKQSTSLFYRMKDKPSSYINNFFKFNFSDEKINFENFKGILEPLEVAMAADYKDYLQNDILVKVDRSTMASSIEGREPFLDHRIIEFAARLPLNYKYDGITTKKILRDIVHEYIPESKLNRPKTGFSLPISNWLQTDLKFLLDEYLSRDALKWSNLFNEDFVLNEVEKFKQNKLHYTPIIWYLLCFQMWYKRWML